MKARKERTKKSTQTTDGPAAVGRASKAPAQGPTQAKKPRKPSKAAAKPSSKASTLTQEQIEEHAKAIWLKSGCLPGRDEANWHEAEAQLKAELGID